MSLSAQDKNTVKRSAVAFPICTMALLAFIQQEITKECMILTACVTVVSILGYFALVSIGNSESEASSSGIVDPLHVQMTEKKFSVYEADSFETLLRKLSDGVVMEQELVGLLHYLNIKVGKKDVAEQLAHLAFFPILVAILKDFVGKDEIMVSYCVVMLLRKSIQCHSMHFFLFVISVLLYSIRPFVSSLVTFR